MPPMCTPNITIITFLGCATCSELSLASDKLDVDRNSNDNLYERTYAQTQISTNPYIDKFLHAQGQGCVNESNSHSTVSKTCIHKYSFPTF